MLNLPAKQVLWVESHHVYFKSLELSEAALDLCWALGAAKVAFPEDTKVARCLLTRNELGLATIRCLSRTRWVSGFLKGVQP